MPMFSGRLPVKEFPRSEIPLIPVLLNKVDGISPVKLLLSSAILSRLLRLPISRGTSPAKSANT